MRKRMRKNWKKGIIVMMAALFVAMAVAEPVPAQAAAKTKITVKVKSPKKNVALSEAKLTAHTKTPIQLTVKAPVTKTATGNVTAKATYKTSNKKVVSVSRKGKLTVKKNGTATITVKYKGTSKKIKLTVAAKHNWKAHKKTKTVKVYYERCNCGAKFYGDDCDEKLEEHSINHILNHEPSNWWCEYENKKVTYTDYYHCTCGARKAGEPEPKDEK